MGNGAAVLNNESSFPDPAANPEQGFTEEISLCSPLVAKKLTHGCNLFIQNEKAREIFISYLKGGEWIQSLKTSEDPDGPLGHILAAVNATSVKATGDDSKMQNKYEDYILPGDMDPTFIKNSFCDSASFEHFGEDVAPARLEQIIESCFSASHLRSVLLASIFPIFLRSSHYAELIKQNTESSELDMKANRAFPPEQRDLRLDELFKPKNRRLRELIQDGLGSVDYKELNYMLRSGDWLQHLIATVEELPLCVSLATARKDRPGFPLVYVNKAFELTTMYHRNDIIGRNCKFLQSDKSEESQIQIMSNALASAQPVKVALYNRRKDGEDFFNLLAMKPVFDTEGVYSYVIGVQYDISKKNASLKEIRLINDVLSILPSVLK